MTDFNLADSYRSAGLAPTPDIMKLRQAPFDDLADAPDASRVVELVRMQFGLPVSDGAPWFREAFGTTDPTFSMIDNEREIAVLAACVLAKQIADEDAFTAIALVCAGVQGLRTPLVAPAVVTRAEAFLGERAVRLRTRNRVGTDTVRLPAKSKIPAEAAPLAQSGDWAVVSNLLARASDEATDRIRTAITQLTAVLAPLVQDVVDLREETAMLWWHIGGWSRLLEAPFASFEPGAAAILCGIDLADLSETITGPAAAPAMLQRTIAQGRKSRLAKVVIAEAVNLLKTDEQKALDVDGAIAGVQDLCPVLAAVAKAAEVGDSAAWPAILGRANGFDTAQALTPLALAQQSYWERQLLYGLL